MPKTKTRKTASSQARRALEHARRFHEDAQNWIEFHNALFGIGGKLGELFPTPSERTAFVKTAEYKEIMEMLQELQQGDLTLPGPLARASGTIIVRAPKSIHAALLAEAEAEDVSLNQLCVAKLCSQLRAVVQ